MKVKGMGHIGINTGDIRKSLHFYQDVLGCAKINVTDWPDNQMTTLELPDGSLIELFDYGLRTQKAESRQSDVGYRHIAFLVDDVSVWEEYLEKHGIKVTVRPVAMEQIGTKGMLCLDPDGIEVELYEKL